jgi:hypothetical protein
MATHVDTQMIICNDNSSEYYQHFVHIPGLEGIQVAEDVFALLL